MKQRTAIAVSPDGEIVADIYQVEPEPTVWLDKSVRIFTGADKREKMKLAKLSGMDRELLDLALSKVVNNTGRIDFHPAATAKVHGCSRNTVYLFINKMLANQFFLRVDDNLHINPNFFWVGSNLECVKNRQHLKLVSVNGKLS